MADFNPKTIKGNIGGVYFTKTKEAVDPFNLTKYNPNTNQNIILFHLEDGVENNIVTVNFAPNDSSMPKKGWTSHDFPAIFRGYVDHTVNGEAIPRTFAQYLALVPTLITDLNLNNKKPLSFNATVIQQSGVNLLGSFNTLTDLINAHTPTESLHDNDAIAYVYENGQNGYYKVYFSSGSSTWYWGVYQGAISTSLSEVQYNLTGLQVQGGFRNPAPIVPLQDEQYRIIWQYLNELYAQDSVIEGELGELAQEIIELNTAVVKTISKTDSNTIIIDLSRIGNDVNIQAVVNVSSNSYNLLKVVGSDGLEVNPEDIINEIIFEINNTNSALRQAIDDIVDNKITAHNTNSEAHQDIRNDIETAEQNANEYTDDEIIKVEQKIDTHTSNKNNPHEVTAEQVDTYTKLAIDNKDANTLQEAKDYTYSKVEIDNKDTAIMNKANNLENANMFKDVNYNNQNGVLTFTKYDNTTKEIDLPLELLVESGYYDEVANELVLVLANSSEIRIPVGNLLTDLDAHNIRFNGSGTNYLTTKTEVESAVKELDTRIKANANDKVDKVSGKGLSTNDYTTNEKNKLDGIEAGAEVNTVDSVNGQTGVVVLDAEDVGALPDDTPLFSGDYDDLSNKPTIDQLLGNLSTLGFVKRTGTNNYVIDTSNYQPLDADLSSIAGLSGTSGLLRKTASNTWQLDTSVYLTEITKLMVEAVLTGTITTHTHNASAIVEDASHRFVTDTEKNTWDAKQNALGFTPENAANKKTTLSDSDVEYPTSKAVKTAIETAVSQTLKPMGNWNANTNTPTLTDSNINRANEMYYVSVAGTQFGIEFDVGDELVYNTNGVIFRRDNVDAVVSVNTKQGVVVLNQDDIGDGATYKRVTTAEKNTWNNKVDKVAGKGLSTEDYTSAEKTKLSGIEAGAQVNAVTSVAGKTGAVVLAKADVGLGSVQNYAIASKTEAESGTSNVLYMTPLRTKEAITAAMGDIESALDAILGV